MRFLVIFLLAISFSAEAVKHKSLSQMLIDQEAARQAEARRIAANKAAVAATLAAGGGRGMPLRRTQSSFHAEGEQLPVPGLFQPSQPKMDTK